MASRPRSSRRYFTPSEADEDVAIRHNGVRQTFEEELNLISTYDALIARYYVEVRVTEDPTLRKHIQRLSARCSKLRSAFIEKWNRPSRKK